MDNYPIKVLMIAKNENVILSTGEYELSQANFKYDKRAGNQYPNLIKIDVPQQHEIILNVEKIIDADNLLFELNPITRFIAKRLLKLKLGYFRLNSNFILNITHEGKTYEEKGTTLHEMVITK